MPLPHRAPLEGPEQGGLNGPLPFHPGRPVTPRPLCGAGLPGSSSPRGSHRGLLLDSAPSGSTLPSPGPSPHSVVPQPLQPGAASVSPWPARPQLRRRFLQEVPQSMAGPSPLLEGVLGALPPGHWELRGSAQGRLGRVQGLPPAAGTGPIGWNGHARGARATPLCGRGAESPSDPAAPGKEGVSAPYTHPCDPGRAGGVPQAGAGRPRAGGR